MDARLAGAVRAGHPLRLEDAPPQPGFAAIVILTLGLGIGANTAIFSLMDQVLLRALPVDRPEELVLIDAPGIYQGRTTGTQVMSVPMFRGLSAANQCRRRTC